jgi:hypothetical protein
MEIQQVRQDRGPGSEQRMGVDFGEQPRGRRETDGSRQSRSKDASEERLAHALGWFSIGLGLAEVAAPRGIAQLIGVEVGLEMQFSPPGGVISAKIAKLWGEEPEQQVQEDLRSFNRVMETGEIATTEGQPSGGARSRG